MTNKIKVYLIEDNKLIQVGINCLFEENSDIELVGESSLGLEALKAIKIQPVDVILLDLKLPDISGLELIEKLQQINNKIKIIILSVDDSKESVLKALSLGVYGYIFKDINTDILIPIIKSVNKGAMWLAPKVVAFLKDNQKLTLPQKKISKSEFKNTHADLTEREYQVLKLIVDGKSNIDIANILCISEHTAKAHVCNIMQKMVVDDRTQAAVKALKDGLV